MTASTSTRRNECDAAVVGLSTGATCGVRDHAALLTGALEELDVSCSLHWLTREQTSLRGARSEIGAWARRLAADLDEQRPKAILLHYSVFSYGHRGLPLFVRPLFGALKSAQTPIVTVLHEMAYPWGLGGAGGFAWAATQRAALIDVVRSSAALVVTTSSRIEWLESRRWLARRPMALAPVFSNLPSVPDQVPHDSRMQRRLGLFGWAYQGAARELILDAMSMLVAQELDFRLVLLGAPGSDSPAADVWRKLAHERGLAERLEFSGILGARELAGALAACDVLLHPEPEGPTSRKGTLAASLASGAPVVALDGPRRWDELLSAEAAAVVTPAPAPVAEAVARLLADERTRRALGQRGADFAQHAMGVGRSAQVVARLLDELDRPSPVAAGAARSREVVSR